MSLANAGTERVRMIPAPRGGEMFAALAFTRDAKGLLTTLLRRQVEYEPGHGR